MPITLLVAADPAETYLKPLERLPSDTRVIVTNDRARLREVAPEADVLMNGDFRDPTPFLDTFPLATRLRWIHVLPAGVEKSLSPEIVASPVPMTNGRDLFSRPLAEWVIGSMIYFAYDYPRLARNQKLHKWEPFDREPLVGQTLGIIGLGGIGRALAERVRPFGMRILGVRRVPAPDPLVDATYAPAQINEMLAQCDFVAVAAPLTKETEGLISHPQFAAMKPSAVIVNVGRGPVIDEAALLEALKSHKIHGAALDVFDKEPLAADHPFWDLENLLISPHTADRTKDLREIAVQFFVDNFERFRKGEPLQNIVNKHAGY
jgi:phosphoglycerate dehydrogenase-like enzyme